MELIKQYILDLKQFAISSRTESDVQDPLSPGDERKSMNRTHERTNEESRKQKKRRVRDNKPNDWQTPL